MRSAEVLTPFIVWETWGPLVRIPIAFLVCLKKQRSFAFRDCQCGYTDPRDNYFAQISYDYTHEKTSVENREWLRELPTELRLEIDGIRFLLCHGSPRKVNEFLWESTTSTHFLGKLANDFQADVIIGTHSGIHWSRNLAGGRRFVNVGVLGRPENDGRTNVWYTFLQTGTDRRGDELARENHGHNAISVDVDFVPVEYDYERLACEMREEKLPEEFVETILSGWWTTCLEVLPAKERRRGQF